MILAIILIALGMVALTIFLIEKIKAYSLKATLFKTIASVLFISLGVWCNYSSGNSPIGVFFIIALVFGLIGDIFLDFKYVFPQEDKLFTYAGFTVFGIGHILYMIGMFTTYYDVASWPGNLLYILIPLVSGALVGLVILLLEKPMKLHFGSMKWVCFAYASLLFASFVSSIEFSYAHQFHSVMGFMLIGGFALFAVSDLILSGTYFGEGKERPVDIVTNAVTYYAAQFTIAFSLFFLTNTF